MLSSEVIKKLILAILHQMDNSVNLRSCGSVRTNMKQLYVDDLFLEAVDPFNASNCCIIL